MLVTLTAYGTAHFLVDAACVAVALSVSSKAGMGSVGGWSLVVAYNLLAFAGQAPLGLLVDRWRSPRLSAAAGCILAGCAVVGAGALPISAVCLAGLGNALFHVGGGAISLSLTPNRATGPGLFVAPGALGLTLGVIVGRSGVLVVWPFLLLLVGACVSLLALETPPIDYHRHAVETKPGHFELILVLVCFAIGVRSIMGSVVVCPWKSDLGIMMSLTVAAVIGKAAGGILADRFGWVRVTAAAMLVSVPFVSLGAQTAYLAVLGMVLLQIPMSVTLTAIARMFPGAPSFSFGLPCLVLIIGSIQTFTVPMSVFSNEWVSCCLLLASAVGLLGGLRLLSGATRLDRQWGLDHGRLGPAAFGSTG